MTPQDTDSGYAEITMEMTFDAGHRIVGHKGKCARLHGHTYRVRISVAGKVQEPGFVVDFGDLKEIVNEWDHRLLLWEQDPWYVSIEEGHEDYGIVRLPFNPTAENMAGHLCRRIYTTFKNVDKVTVLLWETPKAAAKAVL